MAEPETCPCAECRALDELHPNEGRQFSLLDAARAIPPPPSAAAIVSALRAARLRVSTETALQASIGEALEHAGVSFEREARLAPGERIDFLAAGGVGIEAKGRYAKRSIYRQLERYAARDQITALILVTGTAMGLPPEIDGKPLYFVSCGRSSL